MRSGSKLIHLNTFPESEIQMLNSFAENAKIATLEPQEVATGIAVIFARILVYAGFKEGIHKANKIDLMEMICTKYRHLSLPEIDYAFKIDRYGYHGDPTPHYQLFNAEWTTTILSKYEKWKRKMRLSQPQRIEDKYFYQKKLIVSFFNNYAETGNLDEFSKHPKWHSIYLFLYITGFLPKHSDSFKKRVKRKVVKKMYKHYESLEGLKKERLKYKIKSIQIGEKIDTKTCIIMVLRTFFQKVIVKKQNLESLLHHRTLNIQ